MIYVTISNKKYGIPDDWSEVTMRELLNSQRLLKELPDKLDKMLFPVKDAEEPVMNDKDELEFLEFYRRWLVLWTKIPDHISKQIHIDDLTASFSSLQMFLYTPKELPFKGVIEFKGVTYMLPTTEELMSGNEKHMADATFEEFVEGMQLSSSLDSLKSGDLSVLAILTATYYREQVKGFLKKPVAVPYDEEGTKKRAEIFMDLPMSDVWGAYFFLCNHLEKSLNGLQTSLKEKGERGIVSLKDLVGIV